MSRQAVGVTVGCTCTPRAHHSRIPRRAGRLHSQKSLPLPRMHSPWWTSAVTRCFVFPRSVSTVAIVNLAANVHSSWSIVMGERFTFRVVASRLFLFLLFLLFFLSSFSHFHPHFHPLPTFTFTRHFHCPLHCPLSLPTFCPTCATFL